MMEDSNSTRKRILGFVESRGGRVGSGQHHNFYRWLFNQLNIERYTHDSVTQLRAIIDAMAEDNLIYIEYTKPNSKRAAAIRLK